jgi:hypothetical protein
MSFGNIRNALERPAYILSWLLSLFLLISLVSPIPGDEQTSPQHKQVSQFIIGLSDGPADDIADDTCAPETLDAIIFRPSGVNCCPAAACRLYIKTAFVLNENTYRASRARGPPAPLA